MPLCASTGVQDTVNVWVGGKPCQRLMLNFDQGEQAVVICFCGLHVGRI